MSKGPQLVVDNVTKQFDAEGRGPVTALEACTLHVSEGEFVSILGPSGCGKSTLLNIVAGFIAPTSGRVLLNGRPIEGPGADRGVVFQEHGLFPWLSVLDNITFGLKLRGVPPEERRRVGMQFVELVGLQGFEKLWPRQLSGGMRQRVAIARALANNPAILLMDEPFGALDAQTRRNMQDELVKIWSRTQKTVLFVTHSIEESLLLSDRVVVMQARPGRIVATEEVRLERPRDEDSLEFIALKKKLAGLLRQPGAGAEMSSHAIDPYKGVAP